MVRKAEPRDDEWRQIKYILFELPTAPGAFAERVQRIREIAAQAASPQLIAVAQFRVADRAALNANWMKWCAAAMKASCFIWPMLPT